ncbi:MAG: FimV/HubP family polar landmark protein [Variovorax sp.]
MANPLLLAAGALLAALLAFLLYRVLGRRGRETEDSVFDQSKNHNDSFFSQSSGENVDFAADNKNSPSSSLSFQPSVLDNPADVDPVAEADVYLAYGRDLQAEEILRHAMRENPGRVAIPLKLLEIHAKRRDLRGFETLSADLHKLTGGTGTDWARVVELGREVDPGNAMYDRDGAVSADAPSATLATAAVEPDSGYIELADSTRDEGPASASAPAFVPSVAPLDFDLELSDPSPTEPGSLDTLPPHSGLFGDSQMPTSAELPRLSNPQPKRIVPAAPVAVTEPASIATHPAPVAPDTPLRDAPPPAHLDLRTRDAFEFADALETGPGDLDTGPAALESIVPPHTSRRDDQLAENRSTSFEPTALPTRPALSDTARASLELDAGEGDDPQAVKLSLARELRDLGDEDGARSLAEEVVVEASGELKNEARELLTQLA